MWQSQSPPGSGDSECALVIHGMSAPPSAQAGSPPQWSGHFVERNQAAPADRRQAVRTQAGHTLADHTLVGL